MRRLIVHNPTNEHTKNFREYNLFWDELTDELKKKYQVVENRYFEDAHKDRMKIRLKKRHNEELHLMECEYVIEDEDSGDFWILSVAEQISQAILVEQNNPHLKKVLYSQYIPDQIAHHFRSNSHKIQPWIFFQQNVIDLEPYYEKRKNITSFEDKLFFKGLTTYRPIVDHIDKNLLSENNLTSSTTYFDELIRHKVCLSVGGTANGDLCYRDVECMALGIPLLRFDYVTTLYQPLIPNYHYFSVPIQLDIPKHNDVYKDRLGMDRHAKMLENRFKEVVNNESYLNFVSQNARTYYEKYLSKTARVKFTMELLNL